MNLKKKREFTRPVIVPADTPMVAGRVGGLRGRKLVGALNRSFGSGRAAVYEENELIGFVQNTMSSSNSTDWDGGEIEFEFTLPRFLYDGRIHQLKVVFQGREEHVLEGGHVCFLGDPTIVSLPATSPQVPGESAQSSTTAKWQDPDPGKEGFAAIIESLTAQSAALTKIVGSLPAATSVVETFPAQAPLPGPPLPLASRYGEYFYDARQRRGSGPDIVWLGVIDWHYRIQRPQHLATRLADLGSRVFYISIVFEAADERSRFRIVSSPHLGVFEIRLRLGGDLPANIYDGFTPAQIVELQFAMDEVLSCLNLTAPRLILEYPSWYPVAIGVPGAVLIHDCLDLVSGFSNVPAEMIKLEEMLVSNADLIVTSSEPLARRIRSRSSIVVRNGAEVDVFANRGTSSETRNSEERKAPVIGYFGAISEWFEIDWIAACARRRPEWRFELIGHVSDCDVSDTRPLSNINFLGERPYTELPAHLAGWDAAIIPFKLIDLILCTNPVKLYEYMAGGKPVIASAMPEVVQSSDLVYIAENALDFERQIECALKDDRAQLAQLRREWAREHNWESRALVFRQAVDDLLPRVSVIILCYNNWTHTRACLESVLLASDYENLEIIVVDNASTDETAAQLGKFRFREPHIKVIFNNENLGFAAGNNKGILEATGQYIILLNNDVYVTRGWIRDLIRPLQQDPEAGLAGPLTNNIGNEQKLNIHYRNMQEMSAEALKATRRFSRRRLATGSLAFFCVAMPKKVIQEVGLLDEGFGLGFFEDDDYCRRVEKAGYKLIIADDVFVHHHLSASFDQIGAERKRDQMDRNKAIYEKKWGPWRPHRYRNEEGFG